MLPAAAATETFRLLILHTDADVPLFVNDTFETHVQPHADAVVVQQRIAALQPHAIVAWRCDAIANLFAALRTQYPLSTRPLCIALADAPTHDFPADAVLPADPTWYMPLLRDMLRTRRTEARLHDEFDVLKSALIRNISHELRTPLLHIKSAVAMLAEEADRGDNLTTYATQATARLEDAVKNIMQLAEVLDLDLQPATVHDAVAQAVRDIRRSWSHREQMDRVIVQAPPDLPFVLADKQAIGIALQLLIDNALKFSKREVEVTLGLDGENVRVSVRDYGIGIPQEKLDFIFAPFYQIDNRDARRFGGMGIGLAIVRLIVEHHNAVVEVNSEIGSGSVFSFVLSRYNA